MSRTNNALQNTKYAMISKIVSLALGFISRTIFIKILGNTYLGVNGLYTEVLSMLSFAELGFGSALNFAMYKPVAENDIETTVKLLGFYRKVYRIIAVIITGLGICLLPFLQYIVKGADSLSLHELRLFFVIFLANTVVSYFVSYKFSYTNALQKNYVVTQAEMYINTVIVVAQIITIVLLKNYLAYLLVHSGLLIVSRIVLALYLNRKYPILKNRPTTPLSKEEKRPIYREVKGLMVHQFASVAVHQTDNLIISSFTGMGVIAVGLVSNYNMIIGAVTGFAIIVFESVTSGFGNLVATSSTENYKKVFHTANFINFWIYGFCSIAFFILIPPFITLWLGYNYLIDNLSLFLIVLNCYLQGQSIIYNNARIAKGDFNKDKWWALAQAIINLIVSIVCARRYGLVGVYIGTVTSRLVYIIFRPKSTYRFLFNESSTVYYKRFIAYLASIAFAGGITYLTVKWVMPDVTVYRFILSAITVAIVPNAILFCLYRKDEYLKESIGRVKEVIRRK